MELNDFASSFDNIKRKTLKFGNQKINLHKNLKPFKTHTINPTTRSMDICIVSMKSLDKWMRIVKNSEMQMK